MAILLGAGCLFYSFNDCAPGFCARCWAAGTVRLPPRPSGPLDAGLTDLPGSDGPVDGLCLQLASRSRRPKEGIDRGSPWPQRAGGLTVAGVSADRVRGADWGAGPAGGSPPSHPRDAGPDGGLSSGTSWRWWHRWCRCTPCPTCSRASR